MTGEREDKRKPLTLELDKPNQKQESFLLSKTKYTAYGGARGGGKSWAIRTKAVLGALKYPKIRILIIRRTYPELRENHILPLMMLLKDAAKYNDSKKVFQFMNMSRIKLGYCDSDSDVLQYQGQEYDWIFIDEATQITEFQADIFKACLRGVNDIPKRMYFSCNPGGVGHAWVKRLFIDRDYRAGEDPEEYSFIPARVYDNTALLKADPGYVKNLESLPLDLRKAWLEGSWDIFAGQYFREFQRDIHVITPFIISSHWQRFRCLDYGLDTCCCLWLAVDEEGRIYVYRELFEADLILSQAAKRIIEMTPKGENIKYTVASPDLWNRRQESSESGAEVMFKSGLKGLLRANNERISGWRLMREYLQVAPDEFGEPGARLKIFDSCVNLIRSIPALIYDEKNTEDCAGEPHQYTHAPEALRYGLMSRPPLSRAAVEKTEPLPDQGFRNRTPVLGGKVKIKEVFK